MVDSTSAITIIRRELEKASVKACVGGDVNVHGLRKYRDWNSHFLTHSPISLAPQLFIHKTNQEHFSTFGVIVAKHQLNLRKEDYCKMHKPTISFFFCRRKGLQCWRLYTC